MQIMEKIIAWKTNKYGGRFPIKEKSSFELFSDAVNEYYSTLSKKYKNDHRMYLLRNDFKDGKLTEESYVKAQKMINEVKDLAEKHLGLNSNWNGKIEKSDTNNPYYYNNTIYVPSETYEMDMLHEIIHSMSMSVEEYNTDNAMYEEGFVHMATLEISKKENIEILNSADNIYEELVGWLHSVNEICNKYRKNKIDDLELCKIMLKDRLNNRRYSFISLIPKTINDTDIAEINKLLQSINDWDKYGHYRSN